jgi:hypothetical protein
LSLTVITGHPEPGCSAFFKSHHATECSIYWCISHRLAESAFNTKYWMMCSHSKIPDLSTQCVLAGLIQVPKCHWHDWACTHLCEL